MTEPRNEITDLEDHVDENDKERVGQTEEEPDLYRLDVGGGREAGRDGEVNRGQDHHAGDVDGEEDLILKQGLEGGDSGSGSPCCQL